MRGRDIAHLDIAEQHLKVLDPLEPRQARLESEGGGGIEGGADVPLVAQRVAQCQMFVAVDRAVVQLGIVVVVKPVEAERAMLIACTQFEAFGAELANILVISAVLWRGGAGIAIELIEHDILDLHSEVGSGGIETVAVVGETRFDVVDLLGP